MRIGIKIATIVLLIIALAFAAAGVSGLMMQNKWQSLQMTPYQLYQANLQQYMTQANNARTVAEHAIGNIDGYIAQMETDRDAFETAGGDPALVSAYLDDAKAQRQAAEDNLNGEKSSIAFRIGKIEQMSGYTEEEAADIEKASGDLQKQYNQAVNSLKKITKIAENESASNPSAETQVRKDYEAAAAAIGAAADEAGLSLTLTPYAPEKASADLFAEMEAAFASQQQASLEEESDRLEEIHGLEQGMRNMLRTRWDYAFWLAGVFLLAAALCFIGWVNPDMLKRIGAAANKNMMLVALVAITLFFFVATHYANLSPQNITNVINQAGYIVILATGMLLCIISSANIDLSVGRVMGFIGACAAIFVEDLKMPVAVCLPLCLLIGIAIGAWQGFWIAYVKIPAFVVTLAGQLTFYGLTMVLLKGETRAPFPEGFRKVFGGSLHTLTGGDSRMALWIGIVIVAAFVFFKVFTRIRQARKGNRVEPLGRMILKTAAISAILIWVFYSLSRDRGMPMVLITVALVLMIYTFLTQKTVPGRHLYAMGGNVNAARLSGVKTQRMLFLTYVNMGFLASLAGLAYAVRANSAFPMAGQGEELNAIAACYIGGASAYGGVGTVGGAVIGALTMAMIKNGMSMVGMSMDIQQVVLGLVLLVAVVIDIISKNGAALSSLSNSRIGASRKSSIAAQRGLRGK